MNSTALLYAFSAGMVAAINPCGFALLPAYLSYYLGIESSAADSDAQPAQPVLRGLGVAAAMTLGFVVVFGIIGAAWTSVSSAIGGRLPWVVVGLSLVMIGFGVAMVRGFVPVVKLPKLATTSGSQSIASAFVFGLSYGVASLSCAIAPFIAAVTVTFRRHSLVDGIGALIAYALGMGAIIVVLTLAVTFARHGVINRMRSLIPHMSKVSGVLLILSGLVGVYYGWFEAKVLTGDVPDSAIGRRVMHLRTDMARFINDVGEARLGVGIAIVVAGLVAIALVLRSGTTKPTQGSEQEPTTPAVER